MVFVEKLRRITIFKEDYLELSPEALRIKKTHDHIIQSQVGQSMSRSIGIVMTKSLGEIW